ncbi:hypothetical protein E4U43_008411 [Claviceps pusilla]|uniref:Uncharacterized protein n=1 Tax=Claviceps pusilla TaxID=123648 RepID=A0A9P7SXB3_9HYPO|nr:hypothetical protein E4U43_008411 [Claviceps pusilla]
MAPSNTRSVKRSTKSGTRQEVTPASIAAVTEARQAALQASHLQIRMESEMIAEKTKIDGKEYQKRYNTAARKWLLWDTHPRRSREMCTVVNVETGPDPLHHVPNTSPWTGQYVSKVLHSTRLSEEVPRSRKVSRFHNCPAQSFAVPFARRSKASWPWTPPSIQRWNKVENGDNGSRFIKNKQKLFRHHFGLKP